MDPEHNASVSVEQTGTFTGTLHLNGSNDDAPENDSQDVHCTLVSAGGEKRRTFAEVIIIFLSATTSLLFLFAALHISGLWQIVLTLFALFNFYATFGNDCRVLLRFFFFFLQTVILFLDAVHLTNKIRPCLVAELSWNPVSTELFFGLTKKSNHINCLETCECYNEMTDFIILLSIALFLSFVQNVVLVQKETKKIMQLRGFNAKVLCRYLQTEELAGISRVQKRRDCVLKFLQEESYRVKNIYSTGKEALSHGDQFMSRSKLAKETSYFSQFTVGNGISEYYKHRKALFEAQGSNGKVNNFLTSFLIPVPEVSYFMLSLSLLLNPNLSEAGLLLMGAFAGSCWTKRGNVLFWFFATSYVYIVVALNQIAGWAFIQDHIDEDWIQRLLVTLLGYRDYRSLVVRNILLVVLSLHLISLQKFGFFGENPVIESEQSSDRRETESLTRTPSEEKVAPVSYDTYTDIANLVTFIPLSFVFTHWFIELYGDNNHDDAYDIVQVQFIHRLLQIVGIFCSFMFCFCLVLVDRAVNFRKIKIAQWAVTCVQTICILAITVPSAVTENDDSVGFTFLFICRCLHLYFWGVYLRYGFPSHLSQKPPGVSSVFWDRRRSLGVFSPFMSKVFTKTRLTIAQLIQLDGKITLVSQVVRYHKKNEKRPKSVMDNQKPYSARVLKTLIFYANYVLLTLPLLIAVAQSFFIPASPTALDKANLDIEINNYLSVFDTRDTYFQRYNLQSQWLKSLGSKSSSRSQKINEYYRVSFSTETKECWQVPPNTREKLMSDLLDLNNTHDMGLNLGYTVNRVSLGSLYQSSGSFLVALNSTDRLSLARALNGSEEMTLISDAIPMAYLISDSDKQIQVSQYNTDFYNLGLSLRSSSPSWCDWWNLTFTKGDQTYESAIDLYFESEPIRNTSLQKFVETLHLSVVIALLIFTTKSIKNAIVDSYKLRKMWFGKERVAIMQRNLIDGMLLAREFGMFKLEQAYHAIILYVEKNDLLVNCPSDDSSSD